MITLRPHQVGAADAVENAFRAGIKRPLVDACVGAGKSLMYGELARREILRGGRVLVLAHTRELVEQNAGACRALGLECGINAAALNERTWRAPVISCAVQSVFRSARNFGPVTLALIDESHLVPHSESGMYRQLIRDLGDVRVAGGSGTVFRLQGGSLIEGEDAPFDRVVYRYGILDGIRDGYLCPAFSIEADDKLDPSKLRIRQGDYSPESSDAQMIEAMDNHIAQMTYYAADRRAWLVFEASTKSARAMAKRMNEWGIPTGLVLGETAAHERARAIEEYRQGRLRALVNVNSLTTGFDVQRTDLLVMRRRTKSLGLYIQMTGRLLRTIGGNIDSSIAAGKADGAVLDFAGNIEEHGPIDLLFPRATTVRLVSCEECGKRNPSAAAKCWSCGATMMKNCPACLEPIARNHLDCPHCNYDMRKIDMGGSAKPLNLREVPSGAAIIAAYRIGTERVGGWIPIVKAYGSPGGALVDTASDRYELRGRLAEVAADARWLRLNGASVAALLLPNGLSRTSARQVLADGAELIIPLPAAAVTLRDDDSKITR